MNDVQPLIWSCGFSKRLQSAVASAKAGRLAAASNRRAVKAFMAQRFSLIDFGSTCYCAPLVLVLDQAHPSPAKK
jgi:hypothetical protein